MAGLVKATIHILDAAAVQEPRLPASFEVQFNPNQVSISKDVNYAEARLPGLDGPLLQFVSGSSETIELELFFDTTDTQEDVQQHTRRLHELVTVQPQIHAPPRFRFEWGSGLRFDAVATGIAERFTLFNSDGVPLRALVQLAMKGYRTLEELLVQKNLKSSRAPGEKRGDETGKDSQRPTAEVRLDGKGEPVAGLLTAEFRDGADTDGRFELAIDNWDDERRTLRYSDGGTFDVGRRIELQMGYQSSPRSVVQGSIEKVRQVFAREGRPRLLLEGTGSMECAGRKSDESPLLLAYGESLLELELLQDGPGASARGTGPGNPELRVGTRVRFEGLGERFSGTYFVTSCTHRVDASGYATSFECARESFRKA